MDAATARREARRRRILENSEQRLRKITGVENRSNNNSNNYNTNFPNLISEGDNIETNPIENELNQLPTEQHEGNEEIVENHDALNTTPVYYAYKFEIIAILAIFNYMLVLLEITLWNLIFLPFLAFEMTLLWTDQTIENNSRIGLLLNFVQIRDKFSKFLIQTFNYITQILQDLMVYFFVFVCCNVITDLPKCIPLF